MNTKTIHLSDPNLFRDLGKLIRFESTITKSRLEVKFQKSSNNLLILAAGMLAAVILIAGIDKSFTLPAWIIGPAIIVGITSQMTALLALVLQTIGGIYSSVMFFRRANENNQAEYMHDMNAALKLYEAYGSAVLEAGELWIEQKIQRIERRQFRFLGGPEKYAIIAVLGAASAAWKEVGPELLAGTPSIFLYIGALIIGLLVGGMITNTIRDRLMHQRDFLRLAKAYASQAKPLDALTVVAPVRKEVALVQDSESPQGRQSHGQ